MLNHIIYGLRRGRTSTTWDGLHANIVAGGMVVLHRGGRIIATFESYKMLERQTLQSAADALGINVPPGTGHKHLELLVRKELYGLPHTDENVTMAHAAFREEFPPPFCMGSAAMDALVEANRATCKARRAAGMELTQALNFAMHACRNIARNKFVGALFK